MPQQSGHHASRAPSGASIRTAVAGSRPCSTVTGVSVWPATSTGPVHECQCTTGMP